MAESKPWFAAYERRYAELEEQGIHPERAAEVAAAEADGIVRDRQAAMADFYRARAKEGFAEQGPSLKLKEAGRG